MSTLLEHNEQHTTMVLALNHGELLDQPTFHARYQQTPEHVRAELIGGIVYIMPSPVSRKHSRPLSFVDRWLSAFEEASPGTEASLDTTMILGRKSEPEPDAYLRILPEYGGRSTTNEDDYIVGPPELLVEVAISSAAFDLNQKKSDYEEAGIQEYLVVLTEGLQWFELKQGKYHLLPLDEDGILRSRQFPGLWLDPQALLSGNIRRLRQIVRQGIASPEHRVWVKTLTQKCKESRKGVGKGRV